MKREDVNVTRVCCGSAPGHCDHASSSVNGNASVSKSHSSHANGYICRHCSSHPHSHKSAALSAAAASPLSSQTAEASSDIQSSISSSPFTSIYSRDRSRRTKTGTFPDAGFFNGAVNHVVLKHCERLCPGVVSSLCNTCVRYSKRLLAPVTSFVALLFSSVLWLRSKAKSPQGEGTKTDFQRIFTRFVGVSPNTLAFHCSCLCD